MSKKSFLTKDIVLILAASFFYLSSPMLITPLITGFSKTMGASATLMGIVGGMMNLCALFCRPFAGNLADRISKYHLTFVGTILMSIACLGYIFAANSLMIILARIINGIGYSLCSVCMSTWLSDLLPRENIGSGMGFYGMMNALGMAIAPAIGVSLYKKIGYRMTFALALAFAVATITLIQFVSDKDEPKKPISENRKLAIIDINVVPIAIIIMLFAIPYCMTQSFLVSYVEERGLSVSVSLFFPVYAVILLVLRFSMKSLFDRLPFGVFLFAGSACAAVSILCLANLHNNFIMVIAAAFMAGGYGIMCSVCQSTAMLLAGEGKRGLANSTYYIGLDLGMTLGPVLGGVLFGKLPLTYFYPVMLLTIPFIIVIYLSKRKALRGK